MAFASEIRVAMHIEIFQLLEGIPWEKTKIEWSPPWHIILT